MVDDVLRLRATVVSDEALANIRRIGREIGLVQAQGGKGAVQAASSWQLLGKQIKGVSTELMGAVPALGGFGLGAAGAGVAARVLISTLGDISKNIIQLGYASKELGLSTKELKGFQDAAAKVGIAPEAIMQGLAAFKRNTDDFKNRMGTLRQELVALGAGPVVDAINRATEQIDKVKIAMDFKETLDKLDPSGVKGRRFMEMMGLGAEFSRVKISELEKEIANAKLVTPEQEQAAKQFQDKLIDLGRSWEELKNKFGTSMMPAISKDLEDLNAILGVLDKISDWKIPDWLKNITSGDRMARKLGFDPLGLRAQHDAEDKAAEAKALADAKTPAERKAAEEAAAAGRERRMEKTPEEAAAEAAAARAKQDAAMDAMREIERQRREMWNRRPEYQGLLHKSSFGGATSSNAEDGVSRIIQIGVFDALVQFKGYMESGGTAGGDGGGIQRASFGRVGGGSGGQGAARPGPGGQGRGPSGATTPAGVGSGGSFMDALAGVESGDQNIVSGTDRDSQGRRAAEGGNVSEISQGHFQIQTATWRQFAARAGVDINRYPTAMSAPRDVQAQVASVIPFSRFGGRTQRMMRERFGPLDSGMTVGELAKQHGTGFKPSSGGPSGGTVGPDAENAPGGDAPAAFIMHHTGGRGTPESVVDYWRRSRPGIGSQFIMDREGNIHDTRKEFGYVGTNQMLPGWGKGAGLSNRNTVGMEIIAKDDKDVTPAQAAAAAAWMKRNYPNTPVWGHGEVNPGHKQEREGMTAKEAVEAERRRRQQPIDTGRIDAAVAPPAPSGQVNVTVNSNGTKAEAQTKTDGQLFQPPTIKQHRQMQPTNDAGGGIEI